MPVIRIGWRSLLRAVAIALGVVAAWWIVLWLAVPPLARWQIETRLGAALGRPVTIDAASFRPWSLVLTLEGVRIGAAPAASPEPRAPAPAAAPPQLEVRRIVADADARSIWRLAPVLAQLTVEAPVLRIARTLPGRYDVDDLFARWRAPAAEPVPAGAPGWPRFGLYNVLLRDGRIEFDDRVLRQRHEVAALQFGVPFVSTLPDAIETWVEPQLKFALDGTAFALQGRALPFAATPTSTLTLQAERWALAPWWGYLPESLPLRPARGWLDAALQLEFTAPPDAVPKLALRGRIGLRDLDVSGPEGGGLAALRSLDVELRDLRPLERQVALANVKVGGLQLDVRREPDGRLEWQRIVERLAPERGPTSAAPASPASPASPAASAASAGSMPAGGAPAHGWTFAVDRVEFADGTLRWRDAAVAPAAALDATALTLAAERLRWPVDSPVSWKGSWRLALRDGKQPRDAGRFEIDGRGTPAALALTARVEGFELPAAAPYLRPVVATPLAGRLAVQAAVEWRAGEAPAVAVRALQLEKLELADLGQARRPGLRIDSLALDEAAIDPGARHAALGALRIDAPALELRRDRDGRLNVAQWVVGAAASAPRPRAGVAAAPPSAASAAVPASGAAAAPASGWTAEMKSLEIHRGNLRWVDRMRTNWQGRAVQATASAVELAARGLRWPAADASVEWRLGARVAPPAYGDSTPETPGSVDLDGSVRLTPFALQAKGKFERLPAYLADPYLPVEVPLRLRRGELGWRGRLDVAERGAGFEVDASGNVLAADVELQSASDPTAERLLAWQSLALDGVEFRSTPGGRPRLAVGRAQIALLQARLDVTPQGRLNVLNLRADEAGGAAPAALPASAAAPAAAGSAPAGEGAVSAVAVASVAGTAVAVQQPAAPVQVPVDRTPLPVDLEVGGVEIANSRIDFSDHFIKPNYSAELTELNGRIGRFTSASSELATVELNGRAAGTALLEVRGAVNPALRPLALDMAAKVSDFELAPLTPYAGKYAGYAIERGKLSMDVAYRITPDGMLEARNRLVLNQLTFGEKIDSPRATTLPVRLAVALLADRNGVIDLDLPIRGSLNDPQFSVFGLVTRVLGSLIVKALTAPFALLTGGGGGGGVESSSVAFEPGSAVLAPSSDAALAKVAQALADRPRLQLTVTGTADAEIEREAIQAATLESRIREARGREQARAGAAPGTPMPPLSVDERSAIVRGLYVDAPLPDKPRNFFRLLKDLPLAEMEARLRAAVPVGSDTARELALRRGLAVRDALIARGLAPERVFLAAPRVHEGAAAGWTPAAEMALSLR